MKVIPRIIRRVIKHKWLLAAAYVSLLGSAVSYLLLPWLFGEAIDTVARAQDTGDLSDTTIFWTAAVVLIVGSIRGILGFGQAYLGEHLAQVVVYDIRNQFYDHVQRLSFGFHDRNHTGNLMSRAITDVDAIRMFVNTGMVRTPYFLILFVAVPIVLLRLDWQLALISMSFLPLVAGLAVALRLRLRLIWLSVQEKMGDLSTTLQENLTGVRVVKAFAADEFEEMKFNADSDQVGTDIVQAARVQAFNGASMALAYLVAISLILWYGGYRVIEGHLTAGELAQFMFYLQVLALPIRAMGMVVSNLARTVSAGERLFEILDAESPVTERPDAAELPRTRGHVRYERVDFSYDPGVPVLKDISIEARQGQVVALLGAPGSGKSTIAQLLSRFYDVDSGHVTIDGMDVRDATLASLRRNIGMVQQDVFLFATSIRENIAYGRQDATMDEIVAAAKVAQLHDFIENDLPDGYDAVIGERGSTLSGGQRQRLSIARAVLLDPPVLVLDDSTSSVDARTEEQIRVAMESVMQGRTTFVIAHRLSTVHKADQVLVLSDGEIAERGTHEELLALGGLYRQIYELQLRPQEEVMLEFDVPDAANVGTR